MKLGDISPVQVEAGSEQLNVYIGGVLQEMAVGDSPLILNGSGIVSTNLTGGIGNIGDPMALAMATEQMVIRMEDTNSLVISAGEGESSNFLQLSIALPDSFKNKTSGLLGVFNDNPDDDFRDRNGTILDLFTEREIYEFGLLCKF